MRHILTFYFELTEDYFRRFIDADFNTLTGYRIQAPYGSSAPVVVSNRSAVIPFPGAIAGDYSNVNSYFNNSFAIIELPAEKALVPGKGVGFIRVSIDVDGSILAANTRQISLFAYRSDADTMRKVKEATASGTQCLPTSLYLIAGGKLDTTSAACISMTKQAALCET
ncbi:unnamed protein product, partial [Notodromas monacha]